MEFIAHRINTIRELLLIPEEYGVELDVRDYNNQIILAHDPFVDGENFEDYLKYYKHGTMIINIKSERIETYVTHLLEKNNIRNYFFLDSSFPMIHLLSSNGESNIAVRVSEYESIETVMTLAGKIKWVWVDCFSRFPLSYNDFKRLKKAGFKLCIVSPELQGRDPESEIPQMAELLIKLKIQVNAICSKRADLWKKNLYV